MRCVLSQIEPVCQEKIPIRQQAAVGIPTTAHTYPCTLVSVPNISYHHWSTRTSTRQGVECPVKKLEAIVQEQQDFRIFAAHSSLGWSAGELGRFEIKKPFLECGDAAPAEPQSKGNQAFEKCAAVTPRKAASVIKTKPLPMQKRAAKSAGERGRFEMKTPFLERENAAPTTEPQALKGAQAAEKCAAVSPRKAPAVIKTNPPPTQKPAVNAKAPPPPKTQA